MVFNFQHLLDKTQIIAVPAIPLYSTAASVKLPSGENISPAVKNCPHSLRKSTELSMPKKNGIIRMIIFSNRISFFVSPNHPRFSIDYSLWVQNFPLRMQKYSKWYYGNCRDHKDIVSKFRVQYNWNHHGNNHKSHFYTNYLYPCYNPI